MVSRRNIRVKVMQTLYAAESMQPGADLSGLIKILDNKFQQTTALIHYLTSLIIRVAQYAEQDAVLKAGKHLPTEDDLNVNTKISGNSLIWQWLENKSYKEVSSSMKFNMFSDDDLVKKIYLDLISRADYKEYIELPNREKKWERKIILFLFEQVMLPNETLTQHLEEHFINWDDDAEQIIPVMTHLFNKPESVQFHQIIGTEKSVYAKQLLETVHEKREFLLSFIKPKLKNWEAERIAHLDLILIEMGLSEFLYFETIPTKVTINEYIDLAKAYSTPQSGQFVNGILDNMLKELLQDNKIHKVTYKNSTL